MSYIHRMTIQGRMNKEQSHMTKGILELTLEIIYLLTGEHYKVMKNICSDTITPSNCLQGTILDPSPSCLTAEGKFKILEVTKKITELLTGEVPVRCQDVTVYFSMEEWEYLEGHKDFYKEVMMEDHQTLTSLDESSNRNPLERCPRPLYSRDSTLEDHEISHHHQNKEHKIFKVEVEEQEDMSVLGANQSMEEGEITIKRKQKESTLPFNTRKNFKSEKKLFTMGAKKVSNKPKRSRKLLTIEEKKKIISAYERGARIVDLAAKHGIGSSSIATILKKKEEIKAASVAAGVKTLVSQFQRSSVSDEMEKLLMVWINGRQMAGDTLTQEMICSKARMIYEDLKENVAGPSSAETVKKFKGSRGWFERFKRRSGIHSVIGLGEGAKRRSGTHRVIRHRGGASANKNEAEKFAREFQAWTILHGYKPEQVFNCDETGLFWKQMPKRTFITKEEKRMPGYKPMKDRLTLLFCANASGDLKIKPMLVYHSETPRIFKKENVCKPLLSVYWKSDTKAWVTRRIFTEWILEVFGPTVKKYLREKNLPEKAVLLLDNALGHPPGLEEDLEENFNFISIKFLPANTTSSLKPIDQQVISNFRKLYTKHMFQRCFDATSFTSLTLREFWKDHYHILHAIQVIAMAWDKVSVRTLNAAWKKLWPDCCKARSSDSTVQDAEEAAMELAAENADIVDEIVSLGKALHLEVNEEDVEELAEEHAKNLTTEDLEELKKHLDQERNKEDKEYSSEEEDDGGNKKGRMPTGDIKKMLHCWEEFQSMATKWHPNKAEMHKLCALVEDKCLNHFKYILKKREVQLTLDRFLTSPPAKRQLLRKRRLTLNKC
ncbi:tigger transposable element-derived protein 1-like isoform X2 [Pyxicephalus adspersus]